MAGLVFYILTASWFLPFAISANIPAAHSRSQTLLLSAEQEQAQNQHDGQMSGMSGLRQLPLALNPRDYLDEDVPLEYKSSLSQMSISNIISKILPCNVSAEAAFVEPTEFKYHNYDNLTALLRTLAAAYPSISRLYSAGRSTRGRELWVMEIAEKPGSHRPGVPAFKYVGNMHGNEVIGREILLNLIEVLLRNYRTTDCVRAVVSSTRIHILPSMNPDGFEVAQTGDFKGAQGRNNFNNIDLNRNFPDQYGFIPENQHQELETLAIMNWTRSVPFVLSANFHAASLLANYPFDDTENIHGTKPSYSQSPDDAVYKQLALTYSQAHATMYEGHPCSHNSNEFFRDGITNGAGWYPIVGGMQDWNYVNSNTFEITVELGCWKYPTENYLPHFWQANKRSLFAYLVEVHKGIKGFVLDEHKKPISDAVIRVEGIPHDVKSVADGDFWRLLAPGEYRVSAVKKGYKSDQRQVTVAKDAPATTVNFTLVLDTTSDGVTNF